MARRELDIHFSDGSAVSGAVSQDADASVVWTLKAFPNDCVNMSDLERSAAMDWINKKYPVSKLFDNPDYALDLKLFTALFADIE